MYIAFIIRQIVNTCIGEGTFINHMSMVIGREGSSEMLKICSEQGGRGPVKCSEFAQTKKLEQKIAFYSH